MSQYIEAFKKNLEEINKKILEINQNTAFREKPGIEDVVLRVDTVTAYLSKILKSINPYLASSGSLQNILGALNNTITYMNSFVQTSNATYTTHIMTQMDNLISYLNSILTQKANTKESVSSLIESFQKSKDAIIEEYQTKEQAFETKILELEKTIKDLKINISTSEAKITNFDESFKTGQANRATEFEKQLETIQQSFDVKIKEFKDNSDKTIEYIEQKKEEIENFVGIAGKAAQVGKYKKHADDALLLGHILFWVGITGMLILALLFAQHYKEILGIGTDTPMSLTELGKRISVYLIFFIPIICLMRESKRNIDLGDKMRDFEVKLATLPAYIEEITDEKHEELPAKHKLKIELAQKFFHIPTSEGKNTNTSLFWGKKKIVLPMDFVEKIVDTLIKYKN